jgi:MFS family permease
MMSDNARGLAIFRHRDFRYYSTARFLWGMALQIQTIAVAWFIYERTRDPLALGFIGLAMFLPSVPLSLVTGAVADRYDRKKIFSIGYGLTALCAAALCVLAWQGLIWPIYLVIIGIGTVRSFANPAGQALVVSTVPSAEYPAATAWTNSINQTANVIGPAIGGLLYPLGVMVPFTVALICFAVAALCALCISAPAPRVGGKPPVTWAMLLAGYRFIGTRPVILGSLTLDLVAVLMGGATALLPVFASEVFHTDSTGLGLLRAMPAIGAIIAGVALAHFPLSRRVGKLLFASVGIYGLATIGFGLSTNMYVAMAFLMVIGSADVVSVVIRQSIIQLETPDEMRGRVIAVHTILTGTSNNLGEFESGALAHFIGAVPTVVVGGVSAIVATVVWIRLFPQLWARDHIAPSK